MSVLPLRRTVSPSKLELAGRVLDIDAGNLIDVHGAPVELRPQVWALLCVLARHAGSVVPKEELLDAVWPGLVVTDSSLAKAISELRAAFGSDGHAVIKTAARRGYLLRASAAPSTSGPAALPAARGLLFGRDAELAALLAMLAQHRLVTLIGAGGVGKTAVALAAARVHAAQATPTAAWVDLAQLSDPSLLIATIARALGLPVAQGREQLTGLLAAIMPMTKLLVLDNAEHLIAGVSRLTRSMLDAAPGLQVLVTSQAPLRLEGEQLFRLAGLDVPASGTPIVEASHSGAVALLVDQARAADRHFELTAANVELAIELCRRLDGLPLAIRLAAARLPLLGLAGIVARLDQRLRLLATEGHDAPARQQTLLAALDWSHDLLIADEQALFRRLGTFVGGFSLDLAIALARCEGVDEWSLIRRLNVLVERNLLDVQPGSTPRYRMLETQRNYATHLLRRSGDMALAQRDHACVIESVLRGASRQIWVLPDSAWLSRWGAELDNVRAALDWGAANDVTLFASLVGSAGALFRLLDVTYELRQRATAVSRETLATVAPEVQMRYWLSRTHLEVGVSPRAAYECACRMEEAARSAAHVPGLYLALCHRVASVEETLAATPAVFAEIEMLESAQWPARMLAYRSAAEYTVHSMLDRWPQALRAAELGLERAIETGSALMQGVFANGILVALLEQNRIATATERSHGLRSRVLPGPTGSAVPFIGTCARCALAAGDLQGARRHLAQLFEMCRVVEWMYFDSLANLYVELALAEGRIEAAARLLGHADAAAQRNWGRPQGSAMREASRSALAAKLPPERLAALLNEGVRLSQESACAWTLHMGEQSTRG